MICLQNYLKNYWWPFFPRLPRYQIHPRLSGSLLGLRTVPQSTKVDPPLNGISIASWVQLSWPLAASPPPSIWVSWSIEQIRSNHPNGLQMGSFFQTASCSWWSNAAVCVKWPPKIPLRGDMWWRLMTLYVTMLFLRHGNKRSAVSA